MDFVVNFVKYAPIVVLGLLPIMNPLSTIPLFLALTKHMTPEHRRQQARRASLYAFLILVTFLFIGNGVIALFGISLAGIRVAGGLIILVLAFRMLFSGENDAATVTATPAEIAQAELDYSFSPLAMPSLSGPGTIAVVMSYGSRIPPDKMVEGYAIVTLSIAFTAFVAYIALLGSMWFSRALGSHGIQAITKIMGFLLACVAVQFIASGLRDFITTFS
jgi:multiple antibiotic resistance protein